jgi:hypothetical protein
MHSQTITSYIYLIGAVSVFLIAFTSMVVRSRPTDTAGEIVGLSLIIAATWPLCTVVGVVCLAALAVASPFYLIARFMGVSRS